MHLLPRHDANEADGAEHCAEGEPGQHFAAENAEPVAQAQFSERQRSDDQRRGLRAGVAAAADDERHEQREHDGARDLRLEEAHRRCGEHLAQKQRGEPAGALGDHRAHADLQIRRVERGLAAQFLDVFGRFLLRDVEHVIDSDDAEHVSLAVGDRQRQAIVFLERLEHFLAVIVGLHLHQRRIVDVDDARAGIGEYERGQADVLHQPPALVDDVDDVDRLFAAAVPADVLQRLGRGHVRLHRHVARRHVAAGRLVGIAEKPARVAQVVGRERGQDAARHLGRHLLEQPGAIVGIHLRQHGAHLLVAQ